MSPKFLMKLPLHGHQTVGLVGLGGACQLAQAVIRHGSDKLTEFFQVGADGLHLYTFSFCIQKHDTLRLPQGSRGRTRSVSFS